MSASIRRDDTVVVISGKEKGKKGKILKVLLEDSRVIVEKLNMVKRHAKPSRSSPQGGIVQKEAGLHVSNVMFYCTKCAKAVRLGSKVLKDGKKVRVCRKCNEMVDAKGKS